jgi:hypothetical protein
MPDLTSAGTWSIGTAGPRSTALAILIKCELIPVRVAASLTVAR